jgi:dolichyl-phosphate-mannose-protein mannosyltransferase
VRTVKSEAVGARSAARRGVHSRFDLSILTRALTRIEASARELFLAGATLLFLTVSAWWVSVDSRVPDGDNGRQLLIAFGYVDKLRAGEIFAPITAWTEYAPLVHVVAAIGGLVSDAGIAALIMSVNLVFVPLLVLGCYGAGSVAFDRRVGVAAGIFALASPMIISLFHVLMLDAPTAALVAVAVWLLLASRRFADTRYSVLAAVAVILGFHAKQTFVFFVAGLIAVMLVRGGWRHWRTFVVFLATVLVFVEPWYFMHYFDLLGQGQGAIVGAEPAWYDNVPYPDRWTLHNFTWYGWSFLNNQVYLPLSLFFLVGLAFAVWILVRRREPSGYLPELLGGAAVGYFAISFKDLDDPRYTLPVLVYAALIGTFWIVRLRGVAAFAVTAALFAVFFVNLVTISFGKGDDIVIDTPKSVKSPIGQWRFTVLNPGGYTIGAPDRHGGGSALEDAFRRAHEMGFERIVFQPESLNSGGYNLNGLGVLAYAAGLKYAGYRPEDIEPNGIYVFRATQQQVRGYGPCLVSFDKTGIYFMDGPPPNGKLFCPPG